ncbi:YqaJ viral recombinase family protein [Streptomyces sp. URMC 124]|uniref:YqaJ viral recombinase family nuclease n=1 Tax=Streptomyces sp. URMC 124 TaxID=3423405 RepID=UPI003F1A4C2B
MNAPTGILLGTFEPGTPEWDQARAGLCITATEIAAVVGLAPPRWPSAFTLWHKKAGLPVPPFEPSQAMEWGNRLEPAVVQKFSDEHPELLVLETGTWRHAEREWQRATPDRILHHVEDLRHTEGPLPATLLEIKTSPYGGDGWGPSGSDEVPLHYRCQVQWQLDTLGLKACHVAVLISGHDYRTYLVEYDEADAELLRAAAEEFLDSVRRGECPDPDGSQITYDTAKLQAAGRDDTEIDIGPHLADRYRDALDLSRAMDDERRRIAAQILQRMGTARYATSLGQRIAIRTVKEDGTTHSLMPCRTGEKAH